MNVRRGSIHAGLRVAARVLACRWLSRVVAFFRVVRPWCDLTDRRRRRSGVRTLAQARVPVQEAFSDAGGRESVLNDVVDIRGSYLSGLEANTRTMEGDAMGDRPPSSGEMLTSRQVCRMTRGWRLLGP